MQLVKRAASGLLDPLPDGWVKKENQETGSPFYVHKLTGYAQNQRPQPLPAGWRLAKDEASGVVYFWHVRTRETRPCDWNIPPPPPPADQRPPSRSASSFDEATKVPPPPPTDHTATVDVTDSADSFDSAATSIASSSSAPTSTPQPPPPLAQSSVRVRLSAEAFSMITFEPTKNGRSIVVSKVKPAPMTAAVREGALILAIDGVICPRSAAEGLVLLKLKPGAESIDVEMTQPTARAVDEEAVVAASTPAGKRQAQAATAQQAFVLPTVAQSIYSDSI